MKDTSNTVLMITPFGGKLVESPEPGAGSTEY